MISHSYKNFLCILNIKCIKEDPLEEKTPFEFIIKMEKINSGNNLIKLKKSEIFSIFSSLFKINKKVEKIKYLKMELNFQ